MHEFLLTFSSQHFFLVYFLVVIIAIVEGPFLSMFLGGILFAGYFKLVPLYIALMIGDLIGDVFWYYAGYHFGHRFVGRFGKYFEITENHIERARGMFHKYHDPLLFLSKITNGLGFAIVVLFTAGLSRIPFWRFIFVNLIGQIFWSGFLLSIGYFFSHLFVKASTILSKSILVGVALVIIFLAYRYLKYFNKRIVE